MARIPRPLLAWGVTIGLLVGLLAVLELAPRHAKRPRAAKPPTAAEIQQATLELGALLARSQREPRVRGCLARAGIVVTAFSPLSFRSRHRSAGAWVVTPADVTTVTGCLRTRSPSTR